MLFGCGNEQQSEKGKFDIEGKVSEIHTEDHSILVEDKDGERYAVTLPENDNTSNYKVGDRIVIWTSIIDTSNPSKAKALHIEKKNKEE